MDKMTSRSALTGAEGKVVKNVDSLWGVGYNAQSLAHAAGMCQITLCCTGDALCPDLRLKRKGELVLREKNLLLQFGSFPGSKKPDSHLWLYQCQWGKLSFSHSDTTATPSSTVQRKPGTYTAERITLLQEARRAGNHPLVCQNSTLLVIRY